MRTQRLVLASTLIAIISIAVMMESCNRDLQLNPIRTEQPVEYKNIPASEYFPNTIGDQWEYVVYIEGEINGHELVVIDTSMVLADGKQASHWKYSTKNETWECFYRTYADTVYEFDNSLLDTTSLKYPRLMFSLPFYDGSIWYGKFHDLYTAFADTVESDQIVIYHEEPTGEGSVQFKYHFKPNVGFIQIDKTGFDSVPLGHITWKLLQYNLK